MNVITVHLHIICLISVACVCADRRLKLHEGFRQSVSLPTRESSSASASSHERLQFNLCAAFDNEEFICDKALGYFCTFCVNKHAAHIAWETKCVTKRGVKRAEEGVFRSFYCNRTQWHEPHCTSRLVS
jgi:hypothetical protein